MMRFMFPSNSAESGVSKSRVEAKLKSLIAMQPQKITGRRIFLGDLQAALASTIPLGKRSELVYEGLEPAVKEDYEARAANVPGARRRAGDPSDAKAG